MHTVTPARKRTLHAEVLEGSLNWKKYYEQYGVHMSGLVPNPHRKAEQEVCHCWRFIRRADSWNLKIFISNISFAAPNAFQAQPQKHNLDKRHEISIQGG